MRTNTATASGQQANASPSVAILMCTYQGERYLAEQLDSFEAQSHGNWALWVSDDGSRDATLAILEQYRQRWGAERLHIVSGPGKGVTANFLSLACLPSIHSDYYAYADQDDIWLAYKLQRALDVLQAASPGVPALYCARTCLVDADNREIGRSPLFAKPPSFANALMQNLGGGNTMVFNEAARALLQEAGADVDVPVHDWWAYLVVSACGGRVFYDAEPVLRYRQHGGNLIGMNAGVGARLRRMLLLWHGGYRAWSDRHLRALERLRARMGPDSRAVFEAFEQARKSSLLPRVAGFHRAGIYRQSFAGNLGLVFAALFGKL